MLIIHSEITEITELNVSCKRSYVINDMHLGKTVLLFL